MPTQLDDVEQDLPGTEIDMSVDSLPGVSVPQDVILALEHDLCETRSPLVTVTPADPNVRVRVMGVAEVDNSSDSATVPASSGVVKEAQGSRCLVLVSGARSDAVPTDFRNANRFGEVPDGEANIPGHGRCVVLVPQDRDGTPQSIQDERIEDDALSVGRPEEFNLESDEHGERHSEADTESLPGDGRQQ